MISIKNEGIHLTAIVRYSDPRPGEQPNGYKKIEDNSYSSKKDFKRDLKANGYVVRTIWDNRDTYIIDNSDYKSLNDVSNNIAYYKRELKSMDKEKYPTLTKSYKEKIEELIELYNNAMKVNL